jgi:vacuolar-type H+-ATPase subunit I/STV1
LNVSPGRIEALVWVLIYGGLLAFGLGVALSRGGLGYGWGVSVVGIVIAVAGVVLVYVRSRMSDRSDA